MRGRRIVATVPIDQVAIDLMGEIAPVQVAPDDQETTLLGMMPGTVGIISRGTAPINAAIMDAAGDLVVVARTGTGYENVDIGAATARGIPVVNAPVHGYAIAESAIAMMLALSKRLFYWHNALITGEWDRRIRERTEDLDARTLGIIGLGRIGRELAKRAAAFNMRMIAADPFVSVETAQELGVELVDLDSLLAQSDYISIHAVATPETKGLINRRNLKKVKRGAILLNFARGALIEDLDILYDALEDGRLAGVGLDVFPEEPPTDLDHPLFSHVNFIGAPHVLGSSFGGEERVYREVCRQMKDVFEGRRPKFIVNPEVLDAPNLRRLRDE